MVFGAALVLCALFFAEGCLFIPQVGMQEDEVQFVGASFRRSSAGGLPGRTNCPS